jgi:flagellar biosynthesis protein FlhB
MHNHLKYNANVSSEENTMWGFSKLLRLERGKNKNKTDAGIEFLRQLMKVILFEGLNYLISRSSCSGMHKFTIVSTTSALSPLL